MAHPVVGTPGTFRRFLEEEIRLVRDACLEALKLGREEASTRLLRRMETLCRARSRLLAPGGCDR